VSAPGVFGQQHHDAG